MDEEDLTVWCGNLPSEVDEELLYELFLQAAPLKRVRIPNDNKTGRPANYAFVTFKHEVSPAYAVSLLHGTKLYGKNIIVRYRNNHSPIGNRTEIPMNLPSVRLPYNPKQQSRNSYDNNKGSHWVPYNKENRRSGEGKHYRHEGHYNNRNNNRGNRSGPNNRERKEKEEEEERERQRERKEKKEERERERKRKIKEEEERERQRKRKIKEEEERERQRKEATELMERKVKEEKEERERKEAIELMERQKVKEEKEEQERKEAIVLMDRQKENEEEYQERERKRAIDLIKLSRKNRKMAKKMFNKIDAIREQNGGEEVCGQGRGGRGRGQGRGRGRGSGRWQGRWKGPAIFQCTNIYISELWINK